LRTTEIITGLLVSLRAGLVEEAEDAGRLAARIRGLDFQEGEGLPRIRDLERQLDDYSERLRALGMALEGAHAEEPGLPVVLQAWTQARAASSASWGALTRAMEAIAASLEAEQGARALDRMRLVESLRALARESADAERLVGRIAELDNGMREREADVAARDKELAGLRAEIRVRDERTAAQLARWPVRFLMRLLKRSGK
jgi:chromosome segregation ATPase